MTKLEGSMQRTKRRSRRPATPLSLGLALIAGLLAAGGARAAEGELSMKELVDRVNAAGLGTAYDVERESDGYEVKVQDADGVRSKLFVDARSGEILHQKRVDDDRWTWPWDREEAADPATNELVDRVNAMGLGQVYEVERERHGYEVKVQDADGARSKLYVDAASGEVLRSKRIDHDERDSDDDDDDD